MIKYALCEFRISNRTYNNATRLNFYMPVKIPTIWWSLWNVFNPDLLCIQSIL